ncbi:MAG: efflux RND transporter periplasmic adaptor subunit, partial [Deltaproteobacteria bacterium]|nr:efflux RND transporter periplasmic adaptor subunit [Deltaproteobacteria bacterium]MBW2531217.1 efflux RND transporter periplasmic adaptor subunit [Deltaproteobacteria bacterium]
LIVGLSVALAFRLRQLNAYKDAPAGGTGTIEGTEINITARIPARIVAIHAREGDAVKAGELLVELDCAEPNAALAQAKAQLAAAKATVAAAQSQEKAAAGGTAVAARMVKAASAEKRAAAASRSNVEKEEARLKALYDSGAISGAEYDRISTAKETSSERVEAIEANRAAARAKVGVAHQSHQAASAQVEAAQKTVDAAQAAVDRAATAVRECRLTAPRGAVVQTRAFEPGEVVLPGAHLLTLVYLDEVRATFYLPNAELAAAAPGKEVTVEADAYPGETFAGTIRHVSTKAEFTPKNVQTREDRDRLVYGVEVIIPNPDGKLRPGMPAEVHIDGTGR